MPDLPRIFAQPGTSFQRHIPETRPSTFGAALFQSLGDVSEELTKQKQAHDLVQAQQMLDDRDSIYQRQRFDMKTNPGAVGNMTADEFIGSWTAKAKEDDDAILNTITDPVLKKQTSLMFARLQKKEFDQHFNDYRSIWVDQSKASLITSRNDLVGKIASETSPSVRAFYRDQLNGLMDASAASGIFHGEEIANMKANINSDVEAVQANRMMLDKQSGGPQQVLANIQAGTWQNLKPDVADRLVANATRMARMNENEAEKNQRAAQDGMFRTMSRLAEKNGLDQQTIRDMEDAGSIRPEQARHLNSLAANPTYTNPPAAVNQIMGDRSRAGEMSLQNNDAARQQLRRLNPNDPQVRGALNILDASDRLLKTRHGTEITQTVREFKDSVYSGKQTILQHFSLPGLNFQRQQQYNNAINHLETQLGRGVPKAQAMKEALDMIRPKAGAPKTPGEAVQDYIGE